jgi:hypothetical protein
MNTHPFKNYLVVRDDYFEKPKDLILMSKDLDYHRSIFYPGKRTGNLLAMEDPEINRFANWFADKVSYNVFPGIQEYEMFVCFHINDPCPDDRLKKGFIHNDHGNLAGLVYLSQAESNLETGTSIFSGDGVDPLTAGMLPTDTEACKSFYLDGLITPEYVKGLENNRSIFEHTETIKIGNRFNRLIAYDSKMWHRPNSFVTSTNEERLTLLFFVSQFKYIS